MTSELPHYGTFPLSDDRLLLEPLTVEHSNEMAALLDDPQLHTYTGGEPLSAADLRAQYARQSFGRSRDGSERWLNWIIRRRDDGAVLGFVQATITVQSEQPSADIAWVIGSRYQGRGYATDAAQLMVDWLARQEVQAVTAHIHPDHQASRAVAGHLGLHPTKHVVDGEVRWEN